MTEADVAALREEFEAAEGSFLLKLRCGREWDREAFSRLVVAMERCAAALEGGETVELWIASGFWYLGVFARERASHPGFSGPADECYYEAACRRLDELAYWLFCGEPPHQGGGPLPPI